METILNGNESNVFIATIFLKNNPFMLCFKSLYRFIIIHYSNTLYLIFLNKELIFFPDQTNFNLYELLKDLQKRQEIYTRRRISLFFAK